MLIGNQDLHAGDANCYFSQALLVERTKVYIHIHVYTHIHTYIHFSIYILKTMKSSQHFQLQSINTGFISVSSLFNFSYCYLFSEKTGLNIFMWSIFLYTTNLLCLLPLLSHFHFPKWMPFLSHLSSDVPSLGAALPNKTVSSPSSTPSPG